MRTGEDRAGKEAGLGFLLIALSGGGSGQCRIGMQLAFTRGRCFHLCSAT